jgi:hypothetical protein
MRVVQSLAKGRMLVIPCHCLKVPPACSSVQTLAVMARLLTACLDRVLAGLREQGSSRRMAKGPVARALASR